MDSEGGDLNSPTFYGMDSEGVDSNSPTFHGAGAGLPNIPIDPLALEAGVDAGPLLEPIGPPVLAGVYPGLLVAPIGQLELGAGAGLPDVPIDPSALEAGADAGPIVAPVGLPVLGIHAGLLGPPIDGAGVGLPDVPIDTLAFEAVANVGPLVAPFSRPMLGPVRSLLFVKKLTISDLLKALSVRWSVLAISSKRFMRGAT